MRFLSILIALVISITAAAQDYLGENVNGYLGKKMVLKKPTMDMEKNGLEGFYKYPKKNRYDKPQVIYPTSPVYSTRSLYSSLSNKVFTVDSISLIHGTSFDYNFKLSNTEIGSFYFHYNAVMGRESFPFKIINGDTIPLEKESDCDFLTKDKDKFTGEIKFYYDSEIYSINKHIKNGKSVYYLGLYTKGATASTGKGVVLLFSDGTKINKPSVPTDVRVNSSAQFEHSAFLQLSIAEMQVLSRKKLSDFRIYIFDQSIDDSDRLQKAATCLLKSK